MGLLLCLAFARAEEEASNADIGVEALKALKAVMANKENAADGAAAAEPEKAVTHLTWSQDEVTTWLKANGFATYASAFSSHKVDGVALSNMLEEDLKELGMSKIGHKCTFARKLCEALPDCTLVENRELATWSVAQVGEWLKTSGLGDFVATFSTHEIDGA